MQSALSAEICSLSPNFSLGMKGPICRDSLSFFILRVPSLPEVLPPPYGLYKVPGVIVLLTSPPHLRAVCAGILKHIPSLEKERAEVPGTHSAHTVCL